jgi:anti-sigma regulatory factor (Ser/Thr protein kinase)
MDNHVRRDETGRGNGEGEDVEGQGGIEPQASTRKQPTLAVPQLTVTRAVEPHADNVRAARLFARDVLAEWQVDSAAANAAVDVAHELISNAVKHGLPPVTLVLAYRPPVIDVVVSDASTEPARRLPYRAGVSERGLGLRLVAQLSSEWGQLYETGGKRVWAKVVERQARPR